MASGKRKSWCDWLPRPSVLAVGCACLAAASCAMSAHFGYTFGRTDLAKAVLIAVAVAADILKVGASMALGHLLLARSWWSIAAASLVAGATMLSVIGGMGFLAGQRAAEQTTGGAAVEDAERARAEMGRLETERAGLGTLPLATAEAQVAILLAENRRRWLSSEQCTNATAAASRDFCAMYLVASADVSNAVRRAEIDRTLARLRVELQKMAAPPAATEAQTKAIGAVIGFDAAEVERWIAIVIIGVIESGATIGIAICFLLPAAQARARRPTAVPPHEIAPASPTHRPASDDTPLLDDGAEDDEDDAPAPPVALPTELGDTLNALSRIARNGRVRGSQRRLAERVKRQPSTFNRHLKRLGELGALTVERDDEGKTIVTLKAS